MPEPNILRTPPAFKQAEIYRIKGKLKASRRNQAMANRYIKQQEKYEQQAQAQVLREISRFL